MDQSKANTLSYAAVVKSTPREPVKTPNSWFEQIESEKELMNRSISMSTVVSDDKIVNYPRKNVTRQHSVSHSLDSGVSSDNEIGQKWYSVTDIADVPQKRKVKMQSHRRTSVESSSSTCCTDPNCSSDHNSLKLMCQRWMNVHDHRMSVKQMELETNEAVLARRQKQIDYGKQTIGYQLYRQHVAINARTPQHPKTPDMHQKYSRRAFDGLVKIWRKQLHKFDPEFETSDDQSQASDEPEPEVNIRTKPEQYDEKSEALDALEPKADTEKEPNQRDKNDTIL